MPPETYKMAKKCSDLIEQNDHISDKDLMKSLKVNKTSLRKIRVSSNKCISIHQHLISHTEEDAKMTLQDILPDTKHCSASALSIKHDENNMLKNAINKLNSTNKFIIVQIFFGDKTLGQIGKDLRITSEAVRLKKVEALKKLRFFLRNKFNRRELS